MKNLLVLIFLLFLNQGCSSEKVEQTEIETFFSKRYDAEEVDISFNYTEKSENGKKTDEVHFLSVDFYNSKPLEKVKNNERLFKEECYKIGKFILDSVQFNPQMDYEELRINIIQRIDLYLFHLKDTKTMTYTENK